MTKKPRPFRARPIACVWNGEHLIPLPRFMNLCRQMFEVHEEYPLMIVEERSQASHNHYFAAVKEAFDNLAEEYKNGYPTPEHLRADALVQAGFCTETTYAVADATEARKLATSLRRMSPLSIIRVRGDVVKHFEPESQSRPAMKKERFEASKAAVLEIVSAMARTTPAELKKNAGKSA